MDIAYLPSLSTYGRPVAQRAFDGFALSLGRHAPRDAIPAHRHQDTYQWCLTLEGGFEEFAGARREQCGAGSLLVRPPDCVHANRFSGLSGLCLNLFPDASWLARHELSPLLDTYAHVRTRRMLALGCETAAALRAPLETSLELEGLALELLASAIRLDGLSRHLRPRWLAAAVELIESEPAADLRLGEVARQAGVSAGHLARTFRATFGRSVGSYARERRLARAANLLREGELSLAEIGATVGFCDQAHFTRAFKTQFGVTPAAFRRRR
jgi:AraC family transcriptional regulator